MASRWIYGWRTDVVLAWCWVPVFGATWALAGAATPAADSAVAAVLAAVLLISLLHQPLTLLLVYGDPAEFARRRGLFVWTPVVAVPVLAVAVLADLWVIVPVAAVWQVVHTQQQRYGILRIHARKAGYGSVALDRAVTYLPFLAAVVAAGLAPAAADQLDRFDRFGRSLGAGSASAVAGLLGARPVLAGVLVPLAVAAAAVVAAYVRQEARAAAPDPAKWNYLLAGAALSASLLVSPVAGLAAYVTAHALEYTIVVHRTLAARYDGGGRGRGLLATAASTPAGRAGLLGGGLAVLAVVDLTLRGVLPARAYLIAVFTIGLLHFVYDAVIWKTRTPSVAADFGITPGRTGPAARAAGAARAPAGPASAPPGRWPPHTPGRPSRAG